VPKRTWYAKHPADYARDTRSLTLEEHGAYNLIMDLYWDNGGPFNAENFERFLQKNLGISLQKTRKLWKKLSVFFVEAEGLIHLKRMDEELEKAAAIQKDKKKASALGNAKRWGKTSSHMGSQKGQSSDSHMGSHDHIPPKDTAKAASLAASELWEQTLLVICVANRMSKMHAQQFLAGLAKRHGDDIVGAKCKALLDGPTKINPKSWLKAACEGADDEKRSGSSGGRTEADRVEAANPVQSNLEAGDQF